MEGLITGVEYSLAILLAMVVGYLIALLQKKYEARRDAEREREMKELRELSGNGPVVTRASQMTVSQATKKKLSIIAKRRWREAKRKGKNALQNRPRGRR